MSFQPYLAQPAGPPGSGTASGEPERAAGGVTVLGALLLGLAVNVATLIGVTRFGWPPGNVYLLFWIENAVVGATTMVKVLTARGRQADGGTGFQLNDRPAGPVAAALFFSVHYGIFCVVHLAFTAILAYRIGMDPTWLLLGVPAILIVFRYVVELATNWFGAGVRDRVTPGQPMIAAYARIVVLHVAVLLGWGVGDLGERLGWLTRLLPAGMDSPEVALVVLLLGLKTVVDLLTTVYATRR